MASAFNVQALPEYINNKKDVLLVRAAIGLKTLDYISVRLNIKHKEALNYLTSTVVLQDGSACGFNPQGTDVFTQRFIEVKPIKVNKEWCAADLQKTWLNHQMLIAAGRETLPFEEKIIKNNQAEIDKQLETLIWQGSTTLDIDGFIPQMTADSGVIKVAPAAGSTATQIIEATYAAIPDRAFDRDDVVHIFVNPTLYHQYITEQNAICCANRNIIDAGSDSIEYLGDSRVHIVPLRGLIGFNGAVAGSRPNLVYGTDIEDSASIYKFWFSDDADMFRMKVLFNAGTQYTWPDELVLATVAAAPTPEPTPSTKE